MRQVSSNCLEELSVTTEVNGLCETITDAFTQTGSALENKVQIHVLEHIYGQRGSVFAPATWQLASKSMPAIFV